MSGATIMRTITIHTLWMDVEVRNLIITRKHKYIEQPYIMIMGFIYA